jgi:hypothetical protein
MRKTYLPLFTLAASVALSFAPLASYATVLDNFDDGVKTDWQDFTFVPGFGLPTEANGEMTFALPPAGQAIFTGTRKTSQEFELRNGRTIEFKVDLVEGNGVDAFAVLAFIPTANSLSTLAGYGLAKSSSDLLITKGIGKYFYNENVNPAVKNNNVTMVLTLSAKNDIVTINGKILDKDNGNAVLWERTVTDTQDADPLSDGTDTNPSTPYLTRGHFSLLCYEDFNAGSPQSVYRVIYDNAEVCVLEDVILDDFDDNTKTAWSDFTFVPGLGLPVEQNQQFTFTLPPAGQALFTGSRKTSRTFDLAECNRLQLRVDMVDGLGVDSFAVLAFIPEANSLSTLAGYGLAKSSSDLLLTKGIGKYFYNENVNPAVKNNNVTLVLDLTVSNSTTVLIKGQVLDKDNADAVLWERTVVDTPDADPLADGTDTNPSTPYITRGHFALFCYEDFNPSSPQASYQVIYDNAAVLAPAQAANQPPQIADIEPAETANFLPADTTHITFRVSDDKELVNNRITVKLNGTVYNSGNGLVITGTGTNRNVSLGNLGTNVDYTAELQVVDSDNATNKALLHFDTFLAENTLIEVEDYNFDQGGFFDNPRVIAEFSGPQDQAYAGRAGVPDIDYHDTRPGPNGTNTRYRPSDSVRMQHTLDVARAKFVDAGGPDLGIYDYDVGDIAADEWMNYTRTFAAGSYLVYLRQSMVNLSQGECVLEKVTSDPFLPGQTTLGLGSFLGRQSGFQYRNVLLTDPTGHPVIVRLADIETLRLRQVTPTPGDGFISQNYLLLVPTADPGLQRCRVTSVSPADGSVNNTVAPVLGATIQNFDTSVEVESIQVKLNGSVVQADITPTAAGATISYIISPLPPSGALNTAQVIFTDNFNVRQTNNWSFILAYRSLNPANRQTVPGPERGFSLRMVQAPPGSGLENSLQRAEDQLAIPSPYASVVDTNTSVTVINQNKVLFSDAGYFPGDYPVPGLFDENNSPSGFGADDFTVECVAYLELAEGVYTFGARTDDGYKANSGASLHDNGPGTPLGFHNGGPANETFDFVVTAAGLYPVRFLWYERGSSGYAEFFSVNRLTGDRTLINDPNSPTAIKAFRTAGRSSVVLESAAEITGPWAEDTNAVLDAGQNKFTTPTNGPNRFYRLRGGAYHIDSILLNGGNVEIRYSGP